MVIGRGQRAIEEHFDRNLELEAALATRGREAELAAIRRISTLARLHFVWQLELNGLGDAIAGARNHVAGEPFVVLLGDTLIEPDPPVTRLMIELFERLCTPVAALEEVPLPKVHRYGVVAGRDIEPRLFRINDMVEKPDPDVALSNLAIAGRYLLTPDIFDDLDATPRGKNNEVQLTDVLRAMVRRQPIYGLRLPGRRHDIGNRLDVFKTTMLYVLRRPDLRADFAAWLRDRAAELPAGPTLPTDAGKDATGLAFGDARLLCLLRAAACIRCIGPRSKAKENREMNPGRLRPLLVAALAAWAATGTPAVDWPRFRGPNGNSMAQDPSFDPSVVARACKIWTAEVGKGYSAVSVAGGKAITLGNADDRDHVVCFDAATGRELWRHDYAAKPGNYPGPRASPWIEQNRVYTMSYWGRVACLDLATGRPVWEKDVATEVGADAGRWGFAGSPVVKDQTLYLNIGQAGCALDKSTGRILWESRGGASGYSTPLLVPFRGRPHVALFGAKAFCLVDAASGKTAVQHAWETSWDVNAADPLPVGDRFFITSGYGKGCAMLDVSGPGPKEVWRNKAIASHFSSAVFHQGHIYGCDGNTGRGHLVCLDPTDGRELWRENLGFGSLILVNDDIVHFNEKGDITVAAASAQGFRLVARAEGVVTGGKVWTAPVLAGGRLYMRNDRGSIACVAASK